MGVVRRAARAPLTRRVLALTLLCTPALADPELDAALQELQRGEEEVAEQRAELTEPESGTSEREEREGGDSRGGEEPEDAERFEALEDPKAVESAHLGQADEGADESGVEVSKESPPTPRENAEEAADPELEGREPGEVAQRRTGAADGAPPQRPLSDAEGNRGDGPRGPARRGSRSSGGRKQE